MVSESGWLSLYDGLSAGIWRQVFYATSRFGLFEVMRDKLHEVRGTTDFASRVFVGALSGGIAAYISCPAEVAVVRMANDSSLPLEERRNYKGVMDTASRIINEEGISAFWRGSTPFVQRAMMVGVCFKLPPSINLRNCMCRISIKRRILFPTSFVLP